MAIPIDYLDGPTNQKNYQNPKNLNVYACNNIKYNYFVN